MPKSATINTDHFLNRLALAEMDNAASIDPYYILQGIFSFAELDELQELLREFCAAALEEKYAWKDGPPGNCLHFCEQLEQLIEVSFLIYHAQDRKKEIVSDKKFKFNKKIHLPIQLSKKEWRNPLLVLNDFFSYQSLPKWKLALNHWMAAALSNYSIVGGIDPVELLPFSRRMEKLMEAAYWISFRCPVKLPGN